MFLNARLLAITAAPVIAVLALNGADAPLRISTNVVLRAGAPPASQQTGIARGGERPKRELPAPPAGVTDVKFAEFFHNPVGPLGLEYSDKLRGLEGKRVRLLGYMVRQDKPTPHRFLLAPLPLTLHEQEYGLCDDMPGTAVHVLTDESTPAAVPFTPGLLLLTGVLELGNRTEPCGRISTIRLKLDRPTEEQREHLLRFAAASQAGTNSAARHDHHHH